jgi:hypothetical protein
MWFVISGRGPALGGSVCDIFHDFLRNRILF